MFVTYHYFAASDRSLVSIFPVGFATSNAMVCKYASAVWFVPGTFDNDGQTI